MALAPEQAGIGLRRHFTTPEMLQTPQFYFMYVMFVLMATGGLLVTANAGLGLPWIVGRGLGLGNGLVEVTFGCGTAPTLTVPADITVSESPPGSDSATVSFPPATATGARRRAPSAAPPASPGWRWE